MDYCQFRIPTLVTVKMLSKGFLLTLLASSLVAAQTIPDLNGDCATQCQGLSQVNSCSNAEDYTCACKVYEQVLPGACINCWNSANAQVGQELEELVNYCKTGVWSTVAPASGATATAAGTTAAAAATHTSSTHSSGSTNVVGMGFMGLVMALGGAIIGM